MIPIPERPEDFPGQERVTWRREPHRIVLASVLGAMWPPLILTLPIWPPANWFGLEMDWRLDFEWSRIVSMARLAPKTEYTTRR